MASPTRSGKASPKERSPLKLQVIKPRNFKDFRPGFDGPLRWTTPKNVNFREIKEIAAVSNKLLSHWDERIRTPNPWPDKPLINGFKVKAEARNTKQDVFSLSLDEQERFVWNRSIVVLRQLKDGNDQDLSSLLTSLKLLTSPDSVTFSLFTGNATTDRNLLDSVLKVPSWRRSFLILHQSLQCLKNYIFLHMYSPCFDFRFCELRYEFEPCNSWNPLPFDKQRQMSLHQDKHQFQKISDFLLVADQIKALVTVLTMETSRWLNKITSSHCMLHEKSSGINPNFLKLDSKSRPKYYLLGYDHQKFNDSSFGVLRMMTLSSEKAFMLTLLTNEEQQIKSLLCRSEVPLNEVEHHCYFEQHYRRVIIVDKYIVLLSPRKIQFQTDQGVKSVAGPSLTVWNKDGRFKERIYGKNELPPVSTGIQMSLRRMPGKRFGLVERQNLCEPKTAVFILGDKDPIILYGELEDSSANCFCIRNGDRMQFYKYTDNVQLNPQYLFSIRSLLDERIKLCTGGQGRFLTSRLGLPYHIQVYDFPKANKKAKTEQGQDEDRGIGIEKIVYLKPFKTFTRPFKQSKETNYKSSADVRLRILAMASGSWQIDETDQPVINPGANVSLLPDAILIHDVLHDLLLYEPLHDESNSGRLLLSLANITSERESHFFMPLGGPWGRLTDNTLHFFSQNAKDGILTEHKFSFLSSSAFSKDRMDANMERPPLPRRQSSVRFSDIDEINEIISEVDELDLEDGPD